MKCYNCGKKIPDQATFCAHCEADQRLMEGMPPEEEVARLLAELDPEVLAAMRELAASSATADEFANAIFVGDCPACASSDVGTFDEVADVENPTVARCFACGHVWCTECSQPVADPKQGCGHWTVCKRCGKDEDCPHIVDTTACPKIRKWLKQQR